VTSQQKEEEELKHENMEANNLWTTTRKIFSLALDVLSTQQKQRDFCWVKRKPPLPRFISSDDTGTLMYTVVKPLLVHPLSPSLEDAARAKPM
jgi:hypothetical protein